MFGIAARYRMVFKFAEAAGKGDVLAGRDVLVAQEQHAVPEQRFTNAGEYAVIVDRVGEADAGQFGADGTGKWLDSHCDSESL
ncbi:hypothetical protein Tamer19_43410 [Cupriavidus sp. TA19]|nr:hypothetical protein Tamer19_43410 [Cupriavidus sp. TA19]